jgi:hypothetical protein
VAESIDDPESTDPSRLVEPDEVPEAPPSASPETDANEPEVEAAPELGVDPEVEAAPELS